MYGVEGLDLNPAAIKSLDDPLYNAFGKIFKTFDKNTIGWCMFYMNVLPLRFEFLCRKMNFLNKLGHIGNVLLNCVNIIFGQNELARTSSKKEMWSTFVNSLV